MSKVIFDEVVETDYGQVDLLWSEQGGFNGDWHRFFAGQANGLAGATDPLGLYFHLGRRSGGSQVRIELTHAEPALPGPEIEDVVEVSIIVPDDSEPWLETWGGGERFPLPDLGAGTYRVRVSASGRDAGADDEFADGVVDTYLLELWPAPASPDAIVRVGSDNARYWHGELGNGGTAT